MFIDIKAEFLDGKVRYYAGERVRALNFQAEALNNFIGYGWAAPSGEDANSIQTGVESTLDIHSAESGHQVQEVGSNG